MLGQDSSVRPLLWTLMETLLLSKKIAHRDWLCSHNPLQTWPVSACTPDVFFQRYSISTWLLLQISNDMVPNPTQQPGPCSFATFLSCALWKSWVYDEIWCIASEGIAGLCSTVLCVAEEGMTFASEFTLQSLPTAICFATTVMIQKLSAKDRCKSCT